MTEKSDEILEQEVNPLWFESPVKQLSTSGGTAAFYRLVLSDEGLKQFSESQRKGVVNKNYWIGKDLSHAEDEKDFYFRILKIRKPVENNGCSTSTMSQDFTEGIGLVENFMLDYMGVLRTKVVDNDESVESTDECDLLVMRNMRNNYSSFRMIDLKIGEKTAQAGWKGKSRLRAMKHHLMDGLSNSATEGYRLAGFNGCSDVFDSMDPMIDIVATEDILDKMKEERTSVHTLWGGEIEESKVELAKRIMMNSLHGTGIFRHFMDLHTENKSDHDFDSHFTPVEVVEVVSHELVTKLTALARACHKIKIPQKWIGSSVAVVFDAGFFPPRSRIAEDEMRSKVLVKMFDWGRSELMTAEEFDRLTAEDAKDRDHFWNLYKTGLDRLSFNATRFYYNQFTNFSVWRKLTIRVMDFDSLTPDDYIGVVEIPLPDISDDESSEYANAIAETRAYKLSRAGIVAAALGSTLYCSVVWVDFPSSSRFSGAWKVVIEKATNLPPMDISGASDPYCVVMAYNDDHNSDQRQQFFQRTCVKARTLNPEWNETIYVPICKQDAKPPLSSTLTANGISFIDNKSMSKIFEWDKKHTDDMEQWSTALKNSE